MANITLIPSAKVPLVYPDTSTMSTEWYRFFWNIYGFTGTGVVPVDKGGTGLDTIGNHQLIIGNTNNVFEPAFLRGFGINVTYDPGYVNLSIGASGVTPGTYGTASSVGQFTINEYGAITFAQNVAIAIDANQITTGTLSTIRGGTGLSTFVTNEIFYASSTSTMAQSSKLLFDGNILTSTGGIGGGNF
jgi:hypothetical protein